MIERIGRTLLLAGVASVGAFAPAGAGVIAACSAPIAIATADVNVVFLPYFEAGASPVPLNPLGEQLALLLDLETLYRALAYDRWGVVLLTGSKTACDPARVTAELIRRNQLRAGSRLIVVSGRLYRQGDDVFVQTFARSSWVGMSPITTSSANVTIPLGGQIFYARAGLDNFAFPPQLLPVPFIDAVAKEFRDASRLYVTPSLTARSDPLPLPTTSAGHSMGSLGFQVKGRRDDWISVRTIPDGRTGFLLARANDSTGLSQRLPESRFIEGLMGYLRYLREGLVPSAPDAAPLRVAARALAAYEAAPTSAQEPDVRAASIQLRALLDIEIPSAERQVGAASAQLDSAYRLIPYSSDARNLAAVFRLWQAHTATERHISARDVAHDLTAAAALDPGNELPVANLQSFYQLLTDSATARLVDPCCGISSEEAQTQLQRTIAIRRRMRAQPILPSG